MVAIGSGVVAVTSGVFAYLAQTRVVKIQHELDVQRDAVARERLVSRYREPLLRAAADLQNRLFAIARQHFLATHHARGTADEKRYAVDNTLFVVAEYFGWVEIIRREVQSLDLGTIQASRQLNELLDAISTVFAIDELVRGSERLELDRTFRLFRGEQRAIGELMLTPRPDDEDDERVFDPIGFAEFSHRLEDPEFRRWFRTIEGSIAAIVSETGFNEARMILVQHALVDLIDFLDPERIRLPADCRCKIAWP
jgi:hypothetical protein